MVSPFGFHPAQQVHQSCAQPHVHMDEETPKKIPQPLSPYVRDLAPTWCSHGSNLCPVPLKLLWAPTEEAWLHLLGVFSLSVWRDTPEPPVLQAKHSQLPQPFLVGEML